MIFQAINVSAATATFQVEFFDNNGEARHHPRFSLSFKFSQQRISSMCFLHDRHQAVSA